MRALVTGGAGFVGSALVDRLLAEGHGVDVVDNLTSGSLSNLADARRQGGRELSVHRLDVRSPEVGELIVRRQPEVIWHLAAAEPAAPAALEADIAVVGTLNVLEAACRVGCRKVVVPSGADVYGIVDDLALPVTERHPRAPCSPRGVARHAVDSYLVTFRQLHGLEFTSAILGSVYGSRDRHGVVGTWVAALVARRPCEVFGDGTSTRDFVFVDDVVDALSRAAGAGDGLFLNVGTGVETSLNVLYASLARAMASAGFPGAASGPRYRPPRLGDVPRSRLDITRAGLYLDWHPWTALDQGLGTVAASAVPAEG